MRAGDLARRLDLTLAQTPPVSLADALREARAADSDLDGDQIWLSDKTGLIVAGAPSRPSGNLTLSDWLGSAAPLTLMPEKAGAMRFQPDGGEEAYAAVRNLTAIPGQIALSAKVSQMLKHWRETARLMIALLAATGIALAGFAGIWQSAAVRRRVRTRREALRRAHVDLARRGHLRGVKAEELAASLGELEKAGRLPAAAELRVLAERLPEMGALAREHWKDAPCEADYVAMVTSHNLRRKRA